jgi:hypothetical protein
MQMTEEYAHVFFVHCIKNTQEVHSLSGPSAKLNKRNKAGTHQIRNGWRPTILFSGALRWEWVRRKAKG